MGPATSTFELLERFSKGDSQAFSLLFEKYRRRLAVLIHYKLDPRRRSFEEVEEILQETFLSAFLDLERFHYRSPGSFMRWLARIAEHAIIDEARRAGRQKRHAEDMLRFRSESNPAGPEPVDTKTPSRLLAQKEAVAALLERLNALPDDYRQAILLAKVEGLTTQEMAERMERSREAVSLLLHRAVQRFRQLEQSR